jgi:hypothetical protein
MAHVISSRSASSVTRVGRPRRLADITLIRKLLEFWWGGWRSIASALGREGTR